MVTDPSALPDALHTRGWHVQTDFLPCDAVAELRAECLVRHGSGTFHPAGVGAGRARVVNEIRGDHVLWLEPDDPVPAVQACLAALEEVRRAVNRELQLGLVELEAHFAVYPPGAFYRRHLDRFRDDDRRTLTVILYLNAGWTEADGGALRIWPDASGQGEPLEVLPVGGTLVSFLSERFWHEVLPARRERLSLAGWFKRR